MLSRKHLTREKRHGKSSKPMGQDFLIHFNPNNPSSKIQDGDDRRPALKKSCQEFESLFIQQLFTVMRKAVPKSDLLGDRREEEIYTSLLDQELAVELSQKGGIGLSEVLYRQLERGLPPEDDKQKSGDNGPEGNNQKNFSLPSALSSTFVMKNQKIR